MKLSLAAAIALLLPLAHAKAAPQKIIVFDFYLDNTSLEPSSDAEKARIKKISDELRANLQKSGQFEVIDATAAEKELSNVKQIGKCNGCELPVARKAGAQLVAYGWVQKVSNLILNFNLVIEDAETGKLVHGGSVDIRGNTELSWDHGLRYLLKEHVFQNR